MRPQYRRWPIWHLLHSGRTPPWINSSLAQYPYVDNVTRYAWWSHGPACMEPWHPSASKRTTIVTYELPSALWAQESKEEYLVLKGILDIILGYQRFLLIFHFLNTLFCLLFRCIWCFLLIFSVFSSLLSKQYRVTNFGSEKKQKCVFHLLRNTNPWSSHEKTWTFSVFATFPTRK